MSETEFYDHSSLAGKFWMNWNKYHLKWVLPCIGLMAIISFLAAVAPLRVAQNMNSATPTPNLTATVSPKYTDKPSFWNNTFEFHGPEGKFPNLPSLESLPKQLALKIILSNVTINADEFSKAISGGNKLKLIELKNVVILGDFETINLPAIEELIIQEVTPESPSNFNKSLMDKLFVNKNGPWKLEDVLTLGIKFEYSINGRRLLYFDPENLEAVINVPECDEILSKNTLALTTLTLIQCNVTEASIPKTLSYLNVYKVGTGNWSSLLRSLKLTAFTAQLPGEVINLSDLTGLKSLTITDTDLDYDNDYRSSITELTVGYKLGSKVLECIDKIMPGVDRVAMFGFNDINGSILLQKFILNSTATWIVFIDFGREPNSNFPIRQWGELFLTGLGLSETSTNLLITTNKSRFGVLSVHNTKSGRDLLPDEVDFYHYVLLGRFKVETYEAYLTASKKPM